MRAQITYLLGVLPGCGSVDVPHGKETACQATRMSAAAAETARNRQERRTVSGHSESAVRSIVSISLTRESAWGRCGPREASKRPFLDWWNKTMLYVELATQLRRVRSLILFGVLAGLPILAGATRRLRPVGGAAPPRTRRSTSPKVA